MIHDPGQRIRIALHTIEQTRTAMAAAWEPERQRFNPVHAGELRRVAGELRRAVAVLADVTALVALAGGDDQAALCFACLGAGVACCVHCYGTGAEMPPVAAAEIAARLRCSLAALEVTR